MFILLGQRTRFKVYVVVGNEDGMIGLVLY